MSILRRLRADEPAEERAVVLPAGISSFQDWIGYQAAGVSVQSAGNLTTALKHPTVFRSISKIAGIVAQMPLESRRGTTLVEPKPQLIANPSPGTLRPSAWKRTAAVSMLSHGAAAGLVNDRPASRLDLIDPGRVSERDGDFLLDDEVIDLWPVGPLWYVPLMTLPGSRIGVNPIEYARRTTYAGLAAQEFGGNFFRDGAHPTTIVQPEKDPGQDGAELLKAKVMSARSGNNREPLVLPQSVKWHQIQISPDDSQFIELMGFTSAQLAGFFGLQPEHVGAPIEGGGMQYSNRENRQQDLLQDAVMPVLLPLEEAMSELLPNGQTAKFNVGGILRADLKARYESYEIAARVGQMTGRPLLTHEEMRELENRDPVPPEGDS